MTEEDRQYDIVVVGSGAAALSTAVAARRRGLDVLVIEKRPALGGTSARSGGWLWVPGNQQGIAEGDTREDAVAYIKALAHDSYDAAAVSRFLDNVAEALGFFESETAVEFVYPETAPDYRMDEPGARRSGRAITVKRVNARVLKEDRLRVEPYLGTYTVFGYMPEIGDDLGAFLRANRSFRAFLHVAGKLLRTWTETVVFRRSTIRTNGNALMVRLILSARRAGIPMWTGTTVSKLVAAEGRVVGVETTGGHAMTVRARFGVVLATGGFANNAAIRTKVFAHDPAGDNHFTATVGHDGDAVRLAEPLGARLSTRPHQPAAWAPVTVWKNLRGQDRIFPHLRAFGMPGLIAVNMDGQRFANESLSYHDFGMQMQKHARNRDKVMGYVIGDRIAMHRYGIGYAKPWPFPSLYFRQVGYLRKARTIQALAENLGLPADGLKAGIDEFNAQAAIGADPKFSRGTTWFHNYKGDMTHSPNPNLATVERGPFYAVPIRVGDLGTYAGLPVDESGRVLDADGSAVEGLYAVGTAAESVFGGAYPGYGAVIGPAMVLGYQTGRDLAARAHDRAARLQDSEQV